ncbi:MAG TPA: ABC transporter permease [Candidatus Pygmaiobacter gallistercoris]|nr:ABC transporter permease [Candidatus Pygmaiobacter gallistercoris]
MGGLIVVVLLLVLSFLSPLICKYDYKAISMADQFALPSLEHPFGCDELGRDILSRVLYGAKFTMSIGIISTAISCVFGVMLGSVAGYFGGKVDSFIMRFLDIFQSFPGILLAIALSSVLGPGFEKIIIAMGISFIPSYARMMRANILSIRNAEYVEAAVTMNCSTWRIIFKHIVPNAVSPLIVQVAMGIAASGLSASGLSFLGFGVQAPTPEWGAMLSASRTFIRDYPHLCIFPGAFIMITVLSLNLVGDAVRDALDPKLRD